MKHGELTRQEPEREYRKPRLRTIELKAEEVLAVGCKMLGLPAVGNPASCIGVPCNADGS